MSQVVNESANGLGTGTAGGAASEAHQNGAKLELLQGMAQGHHPIGYVTATYLSALWEERSRQADNFRQACPDDVKELEVRQRLATQALQAYRLLSDLERQVGLELALPVLGPWREFAGARAVDNADIVE